MDIIMEWFCLVDDDGSGSLTAEELEAAFMVRSGVYRAIVLTRFGSGCYLHLLFQDVHTSADLLTRNRRHATYHATREASRRWWTRSRAKGGTAAKYTGRTFEHS